MKRGLNIDPRVEALEQVARTLNKGGVSYAVAHGLEGYPDRLGRDLDIVVQKGDLDRSIRLSIETLSRLGFRVCVPGRPGVRRPVFKPWASAAVQLFAFKGKISLEIDFLEGIHVGLSYLVDHVDPTRVVGPFKVDDFISFAKRVLVSLFAGVEPKDSPWLAPANMELVNKSVERLVGKSLARQISACSADEDAARFVALARRFRLALLFRSLTLRPLATMATVPKWLRIEVLQKLTTIAPIIAISGIDGAGKSSLISEIEVRIPRIFSAIEKRNWRPGQLPPLSGILRREPGVKRSGELFIPRRESGRFQFARVGYYLTDYLLGTLLRDHPASCNTRVVIYDRCITDVLVDPGRYGLKAGRLTRALWSISPKPQLTALIMEQPEVAFARKPELPVEELSLQSAQWRDQARKGNVDVVITPRWELQPTAAAFWNLAIDSFLALHSNAETMDEKTAWLRDSLGLNLSKQWRDRASRVRLLPMSRGRTLLVTEVPGATFHAPLHLAKPAGLRRSFGLGVAKGMAMGGKRLLPALWVEGRNHRDIISHIRDAIGVVDCGWAISVGERGPQRKPMVVFVDESGTPRCYVKVGFDPATRQLVQREYEAIRAVHSMNLKHLVVPDIAHFGSFDGKVVLATLPLEFSRSGLDDPKDLVVPMIELMHASTARSTGGQGTGTAANLLMDLRERVTSMRELLEYSTLMGALDVLQADKGLSALATSMRLGDAVPWNIGKTPHGRLGVLDLEFADQHAFPGWDLLHFVDKGLQAGPHGTVRKVRELGHEYWKEAGIPLEAIPYLHIAYLVDVHVERRFLWAGRALTKEALSWFMGSGREIYLAMTAIEIHG